MSTKNVIKENVIRIFIIFMMFISCFALLACGGGGGGGGGSDGASSDQDGNDSSTTRQTTTITGIASLPGYVTNKQLWIAIDGLDGESYTAGPSNGDGTFSLDITTPTDTLHVWVYAVDPEQPDNYAVADVGINGPETTGVSSSSIPRNGQAPFTHVNAETTAEAYVSLATGVLPENFTSEHETAVQQLAEAFTANPPKMCSFEDQGSERGLLYELMEAGLLLWLEPTQSQFDSFVAGGGSLITRVRRAVKYVRDNVVSANQLAGWRHDQGTIVTSVLGLIKNRLQLWALGMGLTGSERREFTEEELEKATVLITGRDSRISGTSFGNCREKGLAGAYIATRFEEFQQVAVVAMETSRFSGTHSFAVACQKDEAEWDIGTWYDRSGITGVTPAGLFSANCMVIDPWTGETLELTPGNVQSLGWIELAAVNKIRLDAEMELQESAAMVSGYSSSVETLDTTFESCPAFSEIATHLCTAFDLNGETHTTEIACPESFIVTECADRECHVWGGGNDCNEFIQVEWFLNTNDPFHTSTPEYDEAHHYYRLSCTYSQPGNDGCYTRIIPNWNEVDPPGDNSPSRACDNPGGYLGVGACSIFSDNKQASVNAPCATLTNYFANERMQMAEDMLSIVESVAVDCN